MNVLFLLVELLLSAAMPIAHPGVGIVQDSRGNVYFTDLRQVWRITPDDQLSIAVPNVHTHELCLDADDNLYGEPLAAEGERWRHRVWCLKPDGTLSDVIPERSGFLRDYSFVRDREENMYWAERGAKTVIKKRLPDGKVATHASADFHQVQWMTATSDGTLFLMDSGDLRRVTPDGQVSTVAAKLTEREPSADNVSDLHYHMGIWTDDRGQPCVAVARERPVLRVQSDGQTKVIARSGEPWAPSGGMYDRAGNLWLLEYNSANEVRARRMEQDGTERIFGADVPRR